MEIHYYTVKEIAAEMKVTERTVRRWIADGKLKALKIQGIRRIEHQEYERFLKEESPNYRVY
jgi:excisionase family DNA binding protein